MQKAWVQRPSGPIKMGEEARMLLREESDNVT